VTDTSDIKNVSLGARDQCLLKTIQIIMMILILESKNLQEQEGKLPSSKGEQERIKGDNLRTETQRISTS
jgi:hypothetical protein